MQIASTSTFVNKPWEQVSPLAGVVLASVAYHLVLLP
jgi:hypothetical protein